MYQLFLHDCMTVACSGAVLKLRSLEETINDKMKEKPSCPLEKLPVM